MAGSEAIDDLMLKFKGNFAVKSSCPDFCDNIGQYGDKELWKRQPWRYSVRSFSWAQSNGTGQEFGFALVGKLGWSDDATDFLAP